MTPTELLALDATARVALQRVDMSEKKTSTGRTSCTGCAYCTGCAGCTDCTDCTGCTGCDDCVGIIDGRNLRHVVYGVQLTGEQYAEWIAGSTL